ncbi:MAG: hypothetical protein LBQ82_04065 [Treponema sp.]|jgi:carboxyl-terminal processing protease|nr:hypothetical protein [Treponema sp.]
MVGNIKSKSVKYFVFYGICCLLATLFLSSCVKTEKAISETSIFDEIRTLMAENYFNQSQLPAFNVGLEAIENNPNINLSEELNRLFDSLQVSHIGFYTPDDLDYYELLGTFSPIFTDKLKTMFPPDGIVKYPGIGIATRLINGRYYVAFIYADTPAERADILTGDELLTVDGQQYSPVKAFQGKVGQTVKLAIRRVQNGPVLEREVVVEFLNPVETLTASTKNSGRVIERDGYKFGYIRMYSYAGEEFGKILIDTIFSNSFISADALILDIRGRWGGAPLDAAEIFVGGTPSVEFITSANEINIINFRWIKPLVVIIGSETRSGLEIMAYSLKKAGFPMIGTTTRGAVVGGAPFILNDGSFLLIPGVDVRVDGQRIEGVGVSPTVLVDYILEYSQGNDPQLETAINKAIEIIK